MSSLIGVKIWLLNHDLLNRCMVVIHPPFIHKHSYSSPNPRLVWCSLTRATTKYITSEVWVVRVRLTQVPLCHCSTTHIKYSRLWDAPGPDSVTISQRKHAEKNTTTHLYPLKNVRLRASFLIVYQTEVYIKHFATYSGFRVDAALCTPGCTIGVVLVD